MGFARSTWRRLLTLPSPSDLCYVDLKLQAAGSLGFLQMLFEKDESLEVQPQRTKTLLISSGIHLLLLVFLVLNPELLTSTPKRIIRIMGQDYDLSKQQLTELVIPPDSLRPKRQAPPQPLIEPPVPKPEPQIAAPPPPQPPPPPQTPPPLIGPEDVIKEGARPDAQPKASRGDTT